MAQVLTEYQKSKTGRDVFVAISDKKTRSIIEILHDQKQMTYTELFNDWIKVNNGIKKQRGGSVFAYHIRKLKHYFLVDHSNNHYLLSYRGKKIYTAISIINQACNMKIANYPSCLKIRVSNALDDEELLVTAVNRIMNEVKKLK